MLTVETIRKIKLAHGRDGKAIGQIVIQSDPQHATCVEALCRDKNYTLAGRLPHDEAVTLAMVRRRAVTEDGQTDFGHVAYYGAGAPSVGTAVDALLKGTLVRFTPAQQSGTR